MLKRVMVHLNSGEATRGRIAVAVALAQQHGAHLVGAFAQRAEAAQVGIVFTWPSTEYQQAAAAARSLFEELAKDAPSREWLDVNRGSEEKIVEVMAEAARYCDLLVLSQTDLSDSALVPAFLPEDLAAASGRPVLIIPRQGLWNQLWQRPLIVWDESPETVRAIEESLALIGRDAKISVLSLGRAISQESAAAGNIVNFLESHDVKVSYQHRTSEGGGAWDMILALIAQYDSDVLVIGAHQKTGFPLVHQDVVCGEAPVPVFMVA